MPIKIIEPQRLYRQISNQLRALILAGEFPPGLRLPAERNLAVQLGVSRPSLREALIALEVQGYVEVRMGSGIYVCAPPTSRPEFDFSTEEGPLELINARALLEGEVAAVAARAGSKTQFDAIAEAIKLMEIDAKAGVVPIEADQLFHIRVAEATDNGVLVSVVRRLFDLRLGPLFSQLHNHFDSIEVWKQAIAEHREILKALRSRKPDRARAAMQKHMEISFKRLSSSLTRKRATVASSTSRKRAIAKKAAAASRRRAAG